MSPIEPTSRNGEADRPTTPDVARDGETPRLDEFDAESDLADDERSGPNTERDASADDTESEPTDDADSDERGGSSSTGPSDVRRVDSPETRAEAVELGVELLAGLADDSLSMKAALDRIETVTRDPAVQREILDTAETRGVIERADATVHTTSGGAPVQLNRRVFTREGDFECRRCGASLSTGHFVRFEAGDLGPFGSSCIRKVTGRE